MPAPALPLARGQYRLAGESCASCGTEMVITLDALQRERKRCLKCDGVAAPRPPHPDQVLVPITLGKLTADALPPVEPGQLRCQLCANGVDGNLRFHPECAAARQRAMRQRRCSCGAVYVRKSRSRARSCPSCLEKKPAGPTRLCTGCNRLTARPAGKRRVVASCEHCAPRLSRVREGCGHPYPQRRGRRRRECETCLALAATPSPLEAVA
jgi:hypothetical protein